MARFTKNLIATACATIIAAPALSQPAAPDTSPVCDTITATVYFAADQTELSEAALKALAAQAAGIEGCAISTIEATAISTDGSESLSQARSNAVLLALSDLGIATADTVTSVSEAPKDRFIATARRVDLKLSTLPTLQNS